MPPRAVLTALAVSMLAGIGIGAAGALVLVERPAPAACRAAIGHALALTDTSAAFAEHMADYLGAVAADDPAAMTTIAAGLEPIEVDTNEALSGFVAQANRC